jgi:putative transposase
VLGIKAAAFYKCRAKYGGMGTSMMARLKELGIEIDFSLLSELVIRALEQVIEWRGRPNSIRCDNGQETISATIQLWAEQSGIVFQYIQPTKPQQSAYVERFNRTVRYE